MANYDAPAPAGRTGRSRATLVLVGVLALLVGGGAGYAVRALTTEPAAPVSSAAAPTTTAPAPSPPVATPCTAAAEAGAAISEQLRRGVDAIRNLDPAGLRAVLDRVQRLQGDLERAVRNCSGAVSPAPAPTGTPGG